MGERTILCPHPPSPGSDTATQNVHHQTYRTFLPFNCTSKSPDRSPTDRAWLSKSTDRMNTGLFPLKVIPKPPSLPRWSENFLMRDTTTRLGGTLWDCCANWITCTRKTHTHTKLTTKCRITTSYMHLQVIRFEINWSSLPNQFNNLSVSPQLLGETLT